MPYMIDVRCPQNGHVFAGFMLDRSYFYRLPSGTEFPLRVAHAWCHRCEFFVEAESLYTVEEVQETVDSLLTMRNEWEAFDVRVAAWYAETGGSLPPSLKREAVYETWREALAWRQARTTPARCLKCGSFFAIIKVLPESVEVPHPARDCNIIISVSGHASCGLPNYTFFDSEGLRIETLSWDEYQQKLRPPDFQWQSDS